MKPYHYTRRTDDWFGETFDILDRNGEFLVSVQCRGGAEAAEAKAKLIVAALNAYDRTDNPRSTAREPYHYTRSTDGCDETFDVVGMDGEPIVSVHFWEQVEAAEAKAKLIVAALNASMAFPKSGAQIVAKPDGPE